MAVHNKLLIPESINLDKLIEQGGFREIPLFKTDKLAMILFLINYIASISPNNIEKNGDFTSLNAYRLQNIIGAAYKEYLERLVLEGVIERNKQYIVGDKNRGYRYSPKYRNDSLKSYKIINRPIQKQLQKLVKNDQSELFGYEHLTKWYNEQLEICEQDLVTEFCRLRPIALQLRQNLRLVNLFDGLEMGHTEAKALKKEPRSFVPRLQFGVYKIQMGWFPMIVDDTSFRFHSNLTALKSELRNALRYDNKALVSLDIKNSQPYFSLLLFQESFWQLNGNTAVPKQKAAGEAVGVKRVETLNIHQFSKLSTLLTKNSPDLYSALIMILKTPEYHLNADIVRYFELIKTGKLYEYISDQMTKSGLQVPRERQELKAGVFQTMFTANSFIGQPDAAPKRLFKKLFPNVVALFEAIKKDESKMLPIILQTVESELILKIITKRIALEKPDLPIFTVHDSIITIVGCEHYVLSVMEEELQRYIGAKPTISIEFYTRENLQREIESLKAEIAEIKAMPPY
ncbi:hypothetical protein HDC92_004744 [Pedobacter sp. AK017]|uniref:hypothetical protein n=1 Tax=Pedobacter sp. AK017 TaxID=2723073 RepID=UPI001620B94E|nr:hypothetical protein [Pedobacter sp. AK017]MBB5441040.1 hypothetical protein [Pedobacter sp. AK017]